MGYSCNPSPDHLPKTEGEARSNLRRHEDHLLGYQIRLLWLEETGQGKSFMADCERENIAHTEKIIKKIKELWRL